MVSLSVCPPLTVGLNRGSFLLCPSTWLTGDRNASVSFISYSRRPPLSQTLSVTSDQSLDLQRAQKSVPKTSDSTGAEPINGDDKDSPLRQPVLRRDEEGTPVDSKKPAHPGDGGSTEVENVVVEKAAIDSGDRSHRSRSVGARAG